MLVVPHAADLDLLARAESDATVFFWLQVLDDGVLAGVAVAFGLVRFPGSWRGLGVRPVGARWWLGIAPGAGALAAALAWGITLPLDLWGWPAPVHPVESVLGAARGPGDVVLILAAVAVAVPVGEELFFRGYAYRLLRARWGALAAVLTTSLVFALVHGIAPGAWLPVLPVGFVFAVLAERSGSLWPPLVAHAVVNTVAVLVE